MIIYGDRAPLVRVAHLLQEASARTGFTVDEIEALVDSELDTPHLLEYIDAVVAKRTN